MPIDRRLRDGVGRVTSEVDPDLDRNLEGAIRRARRTIAARRVGAAITVVAAIALGIVIVPRAVDSLRTEQLPSPGASTTNTNPSVIAGSYETVVSSDQPAVRRYGLAGRWTIRFGSNGVMKVFAPDSFTGVLSGSLFHIQGNHFETNLFVQDVCSNLPNATYQWVSRGSELSFTPIDDPCAGRVAVISSAPWTHVP